MEVQAFVDFRKKVNDNISKVIVGKEKVIDKIIVAFICKGHVLLEDLPGLGKTQLAKSMAKSLNCSFKRIQFTPDMMPSDITGLYFYNQKTSEFQFRGGPILSQFVLADELNRATPRTQSALLEALGEGQVTVEGNTIKLNSPFFVIATQNPVEQFGTFPLPEAQLDRFFVRISLGYPTQIEEKQILDRFLSEDPISDLKAVVSLEEIDYVQNNYTSVYVSEYIKDYIVKIVQATRNSDLALVGASPRGSLALMKASQAFASICGRDFVIPEDVKEMSSEVLLHRIILNDEDNSFIDKIVNLVETPHEEL
ncbi:AAA family ATPase [Clostridium akagii]|uniref:AAA family ATPase n=1 Tax=Clostridium akagii TaxID=91623 RepID=UPI00055F279E|nr:MoxR family ATPase [Clostridium akagii]